VKLAMPSPSARLLLATLLLAWVVWASPGAARAQPTPPAAAAQRAEAKRHVERGLAAQAAGDFDGAIELYKKAYALIPHPELLFNLGQAYRLKGRKTVAIRYYRRYLAADAEGRGAAESTAWVERLTREMKERGEAPEEREREEDDIGDLDPDESSAGERDRVKPEAAPRRRSSEVPDPPEAATGGSSARRNVAVLMGFGAVVSLGAGYVYYERAHDAYAVYKDENMNGGIPGYVATLRERANGFYYRAQGFAVTGVALAGVATYLWITGGPDRSSSSKTARASQLSLTPAPGGASLQLSGSF
jgi:tetratricopeptide (TPR) repeat protein